MSDQSSQRPEMSQGCMPTPLEKSRAMAVGALALNLGQEVMALGVCVGGGGGAAAERGDVIVGRGVDSSRMEAVGG